MKRKTKTQMIAEAYRKLGGYVPKSRISRMSAHSVRELHAIVTSAERFGAFAHELYGVSKSAHRDVFGRAVVEHFGKRDDRRKELAREIATETGGSIPYRRVVNDFSDEAVEATYKAAIMGDDYIAAMAAEPDTIKEGYLFELVRGPVRTDFLPAELAMLQATSKMDNATFKDRSPGVVEVTFGDGTQARMPIELWNDPDAFQAWADQHSESLTLKMEITHLIGDLLSS